MSKYTIGPLLTDLYELTMAAGYHASRLSEEATFSLYIRGGYTGRSYFVAAGLEDILNELEEFRFSEGDLRFLDEAKLFSDDFLDSLRRLRFSGVVYALAEGSLFFPEEPILEISAPVIEAQILETLVLNTVGFQTLIASKAARCIHAAAGRPLIDFSLRRTQGHYAGIKVARSTFIAGFAGTSNVLAGKIYGIPISGTMAHSFVTAFETELAAFFAFAEVFPDNVIFLIDTYDTVEGAKNAVRVAREMKKKEKRVVGVRLDSGDMAALSREVRKILDDAGFPEIKIFASGGFDEFEISKVLHQGAEIDAFGVGTRVGVSADEPYADIVYKMVRFKDRDVRKFSPGKKTLAGRKQVFRKTEGGRYVEDMIGLRDETGLDGHPLLEKVMEGGKRLQSPPELMEIRSRFKKNFSMLDEKYKEIHERHPYPVRLSPRLDALQTDDALKPL